MGSYAKNHCNHWLLLHSLSLSSNHLCFLIGSLVGASTGLHVLNKKKSCVFIYVGTQYIYSTTISWWDKFVFLSSFFFSFPFSLKIAKEDEKRKLLKVIFFYPFIPRGWWISLFFLFFTTKSHNKVSYFTHHTLNLCSCHFNQNIRIIFHKHTHFVYLIPAMRWICLVFSPSLISQHPFPVIT